MASQQPVVDGIPASRARRRHAVPLVDGRRLAWDLVGYGQFFSSGDGPDISLHRQTDHLPA